MTYGKEYVLEQRYNAGVAPGVPLASLHKTASPTAFAFSYSQ